MIVQKPTAVKKLRRDLNSDSLTLLSSLIEVTLAHIQLHWFL